MVKKYIKRLQKSSKGFQELFIAVIDKIEEWDLDSLDIVKLSWKKGMYRCRVWKFRIIFSEGDNWHYMIEDIWSRGDVYK
jgi:mRNA-degrading endonuclease RelE of RelBE toxin-antitoxin system